MYHLVGYVGLCVGNEKHRLMGKVDTGGTQVPHNGAHSSAEQVITEGTSLRRAALSLLSVG